MSGEFSQTQPKSPSAGLASPQAVEYDEFAEWCEEQPINLQFAIKTGTSTIEAIKATSESETANK